MSSRRVLIAIGLLAVVYNCVRVAAGITGSHWPWAPPSGKENLWVQLLGLLVVAMFALLVVRSASRRGDEVDRFPSALWGAASGAAVGLLATYVSTLNEQTYGLALFVFTPVVVGFHSAFAMGERGKVGLGDAVVASITSVVLLGCALVAFALEGAICLVMALPIAVPLAVLGALIAHCFHRERAHQPTVLLLFLGLTPFTATLEHMLPRSADLVQVATSIDIAAPPELVWQTVLQPARLSAPSQILFRAGVSYPLASHIEGFGPSATRYCDFSTGKLVEPVLRWDQGRRLRFTVRSNPLPMQEWTPYARLHPPHLDGFLVSRQGEFLLTPLPNGGTRLTASTWYQDHLYPARYWKLWSDYIIHQVHQMVLENVRQRALAGLENFRSYRESAPSKHDEAAEAKQAVMEAGKAQ